MRKSSTKWAETHRDACARLARENFREYLYYKKLDAGRGIYPEVEHFLRISRICILRAREYAREIKNEGV